MWGGVLRGQKGRPALAQPLGALGEEAGGGGSLHKQDGPHLVCGAETSASETGNPPARFKEEDGGCQSQKIHGRCGRALDLFNPWANRAVLGPNAERASPPLHVGCHRLETKEQGKPKRPSIGPAHRSPRSRSTPENTLRTVASSGRLVPRRGGWRGIPLLPARWPLLSDRTSEQRLFPGVSMATGTELACGLDVISGTPSSHPRRGRGPDTQAGALSPRREEAAILCGACTQPRPEVPRAAPRRPAFGWQRRG